MEESEFIEKAYRLADLIYQRLRCPVEREDALQEAVFACWRGRDHYDEKSSKWATYFGTVCRNTMVNCALSPRFRQGVRNGPSARVISMTEALPSGDDYDPWYCRRLGHVQTACSRKGRNSVDREDAKSLILRLNEEGKANCEIARIVGLSRSAVCKCLRKAGRKRQPGSYRGGKVGRKWKSK